MNRSFGIIAVSLMIWGIGEGMFIYFQPLYLQELGADPILIGSILGGVGIAMTIAHLPAGYLADRLGRRPLLLLAWCVATSAAWIMALANNLPAFVLGASIYGTTAFVSGPLNSYVTAARGNWSVARALTIVFATYNAGAILGPIIGGVIGENLGLRYTFVISGFVFLISTFFIFRITPQPVEEITQEDKKNRWMDLLSPRFGRFLVIIFLATFFMFLPQPLSQNYLQNERSLNLTQIGWLIALRSSGVVVFNLILGRLNARFGYIFAQAIMALFMLFLWQGKSFPFYAVGYFMMGSYQTARALASAQGRALVKANNMGMAYGIFETIGSSAFILAPPLAGLLYARSPVAPYFVGIIGICVTIMISYFFIPVKPEEIS